MAFVSAKYITDVARFGVPRATAQFANAMAAFGLGHGYTAPGITIATTASKVKTANTLAFTINGVWYSLTASDDFWTLAGTVVAKASWQKYLLLVDTAGAATIQEGLQSTVSAAEVKWTNVSGISPWAPYLSTVGETKMVAGVLTVATDATHTFTPGTTLLSAAGITDTYIDGIDQSILPFPGDAQGTIYGLT